MAPAAVLAAPRERHLQKVKTQYEEDPESGYGGVYLPQGLARKYPNAEREWIWQWVFPSSRLSRDPRAAGDSGQAHGTSASTPTLRRHHVEESLARSSLR